ncbi:solute carrier family 46 member 3-like [Bradysia coprophila]|uniref:solute carrier family 46 member 3-like n=1 Tax=Bradysia coprophila TaxID=38358 RepID=UPI00187DD275|nr:solute carrier family 46 member 3-like [Bradysia coprophila]
MAEKREGRTGLRPKVEIDNGTTHKADPSQEPLKTLTNFFTVEPIMVFQMSAAILGHMAVQDFLFEKACKVNFGYSDEVCSALKSGDSSQYAEEKVNIQKLTGSVMMWRGMMENLFPIILVCLIGPWSDKYGRKIPMLVVMVSFIVQHVLLIVCALDPTSTIGVNSVGFISSFIISLTGNNACIIMSCFSYISDTTPKDKLTQKTNITGCSIFLAVTVGMGLSGALSSLGFVKIFTIAAIIETIGFLWLLHGLPNVLRDENVLKRATVKTMFSDLFDKQNVIDAIGSGVKARPGNDRLKILALLASRCLVMAPVRGEGAVMYLFGKYKFGWDAPAFAAFMTFKMVTSFIGNFASIIIFGNKMKMSDPAIGIVSCAAHIFSSLIYAFASSNAIMYIAPIVAMLAGQLMTCTRTIIFKTVSSTETGKVNALVSSLDSLTPLLATPVYSFVYSATFENMPGAFFLLSAAFVVPPVIVFWILSHEGTNEKTKDE